MCVRVMYYTYKPQFGISVVLLLLMLISHFTQTCIDSFLF